MRVNFEKYLLFIVIILIINSCAVKKTIYIYSDKKTEDLKLYLNPSIKKGGIGLYIVNPIGINVEIPELIQNLKVFNSKDMILWEVESKNPEFGGHGIKYGELNLKEYIQKFPINNEPDKLIIGEIYYVILKTVKAEYKRKFVFQEAEIKITDVDLINN